MINDVMKYYRATISISNLIYASPIFQLNDKLYFLMTMLIHFPYISMTIRLVSHKFKHFFIRNYKFFRQRCSSSLMSSSLILSIFSKRVYHTINNHHQILFQDQFNVSVKALPSFKQNLFFIRNSFYRQQKTNNTFSK